MDFLVKHGDGNEFKPGLDPETGERLDAGPSDASSCPKQSNRLHAPYLSDAVANFFTDDDGMSLLSKGESGEDEVVDDDDDHSDDDARKLFAALHRHSADSMDSIRTPHFRRGYGCVQRPAHFLDLMVAVRSLEQARILDVECYQEASRLGSLGSPHRTLVFHFRRMGRADIWVRLDRRRSYRPEKSVFVMRHDPVAKDLVHQFGLNLMLDTNSNFNEIYLAGQKRLLLSDQVSRLQNRITFSKPPNVGDLRFLLQVAGEEPVEFSSWRDNDLFLCSLLEELLSETGAGEFVVGRPLHVVFARSARTRVKNRFYHLTPEAPSVSDLLSNLRESKQHARVTGTKPLLALMTNRDLRRVDDLSVEKAHEIAQALRLLYRQLDVETTTHEVQKIACQLLCNALSLGRRFLRQQTPDSFSRWRLETLEMHSPCVAFGPLDPVYLQLVDIQREYYRVIPTLHWAELVSSLNRLAVDSVNHDPFGSRMFVDEAHDLLLRHSMGQKLWHEARAVAGHTAAVLCVAFSPNGEYIASASEDLTIRLWNVAAGQAIGQPLRGHVGFVTSLAFSPSGEMVVSGSTDGTIRRWRTSTGEVIGTPLEGHTAGISSIAVSSDGKLIASGSLDHTMRRWDLDTGDAVGDPSDAFAVGVLSVAFSPDSQQIVSGCVDGTIWLWNALTGDAINNPWTAHADAVSSVSFSPDRGTILSGSWDCTVRCWEARGSRNVTPTLSITGHAGIVNCAVFHPNGRMVASCSDDGTIRLWDTRTGAQIGLPLEHAASGFRSIMFARSGEQIASASWSRDIGVWEFQPALHTPVSQSLKNTVVDGEGNTNQIVAEDEDVADLESEDGDQVSPSPQLGGNHFSPYPSRAVASFLTDEKGQPLLAPDASNLPSDSASSLSDQATTTSTVQYSRTLSSIFSKSVVTLASTTSRIARLSSQTFGRSTKSVDSVKSHLSTIKDPDNTTISLSTFCDLIAECASLERSRIISVECYLKWSSVPHRFLIFHLQRDGRDDVWLRVDRRLSREAPPGEFVLRGGKTAANDEARLAAKKGDLLTSPTMKPENRMEFGSPPSLGVFRFCLQVITEELREYHLWPEHLFEAGNGSLVLGKHIRRGLAPEIRAHVRDRVWHLVPGPETALSANRDATVTGTQKRWQALDGTFDSREFDGPALRDYIDKLLKDLQGRRRDLGLPSGSTLRVEVARIAERVLALDFLLLQQHPDLWASRALDTIFQRPSCISHLGHHLVHLSLLKFRQKVYPIDPAGSWHALVSQTIRVSRIVHSPEPSNRRLWMEELHRTITAHASNGRWRWSDSQVLDEHADSVHCVAFAPDGTQIISASEDLTIRRWNAVTGERQGEPLQGHMEGVISVIYSADGEEILSQSARQAVRRWDASSGNAISEPSSGRANCVWSGAFSPSGDLVACGMHDFSIRCWDGRTGDAIGLPLRGHIGWVTALSFSSDGRQLVSGGSDNSVRLWDPLTSKPNGEVMVGHRGPVTAVAFSPDDSMIASGSSDRTIRRWNVLTGEEIGLPMEGHAGRLSSIAFSPDGSHIISGSDDCTIRFWDARTGEPVGEPLEGHTAGVTSVAMSPDGKQLVSGSDDCTVRIWDSLEHLTELEWIEGSS